MTDSSDLILPDTGQEARSIHLVDAKGYDAWLSARPERDRAALSAQKFAGKGATYAILPAERVEDWSVVAGVANAASLSTWCLAKLAEALPQECYRVAAEMETGGALFGWLAAQYRFDRYRTRKDDAPAGPRVLLTKDVARIEPAVRLARATYLVRDLVNTPAADMGRRSLRQRRRRLRAIMMPPSSSLRATRWSSITR